MPIIRSRASILADAAVINNRITQDVDMVTLRVNYRFGGYGAGGPHDQPLVPAGILTSGTSRVISTSPAN